MVSYPANTETDMDQAKPERQEAQPRSLIARLFAPKLNKWFLPRLAIVALCAYGFFGHVCIPAIARGRSMEPTYHDGSFLFCWCPKAWFGEPKRGDVVMVRFAGTQVMLLKRIVALPGEKLAFVDGQLMIDGKPLDEPYVKTDCDWQLPPRIVGEGHVYVIGDNRGMLMDEHRFGSVPIDRIVGGPLW
jgi:signal peptidase I